MNSLLTLIDKIKSVAGRDVSIMASGRLATLTFKYKTHMDAVFHLLTNHGWKPVRVDGLTIKVTR